MAGSPCKPYENFEINAAQNPPTSWTMSEIMGGFAASYPDLTFSVNSRSYTSSDVILRTHSEHIVSDLGMANLELQIKSTANDGSIAYLSFLFRSSDPTNLEHQRVTQDFVQVGSTANSFNIDLIGLVDQIKNKISQGIFLNLLTYQGTQTYPESGICSNANWFVYGTELFTQNASFTNYLTLLGNQGALVTLRENRFNNRLTANPINSGTSIQYNGGGSHHVERLCFTGYFKNNMNDNYGLWFGVVIIVLWFIVNLILGEKPIKDPDYQENTWTHHPFVSIYTVGNDLFSRKQRMSLLLVTITTHALFSSVWYRDSNDRTRKSNIIVYAIYSMLVNWAVTFIVGTMLRGYAVAKNQFLKTKEEAWEQKAQNRLFAFYFSLFVIVVVGWPFTVWNMSELHPEIDPKPSDYWVASFFVGLGLEFLIINPIICLLAKKVEFIKNLIRHKGYFYDNICHETYINYLKLE